MFRYAMIFLVIALIAALFGFGGLAGLAASGAQLFFFIGLIVVVLGLVFGRNYLS
ncbi:MAG: DUF1328 domain-containing protein [Phototrophicaceae bacterium]